MFFTTTEYIFVARIKIRNLHVATHEAITRKHEEKDTACDEMSDVWPRRAASPFEQTDSHVILSIRVISGAGPGKTQFRSDIA